MKLPSDIRLVKLRASEAAVARKQIAAIVRLHVDTFTPHRTVREQIEACALDCYVQGLIDGVQVAESDAHA